MAQQSGNKPWNRIASGLCGALIFGAAASATAAGGAPGTQGGTIGYVLTGAHWGIYQTKNGKTECPDGYNEGPREQFKALYPHGGTVVDTQLKRESVARYPHDKRQMKFPYHEATGTTAIGLNLDGKTGANDFTSAGGDKGIDNQLFRAIGCTRLFRTPDGTYAHFTDLWVREMNFNRILLELNHVDSLKNDDEVDVTLYRGLDRLMTDATGANIMPGGSNRVDERFGGRFIRHLKGKIIDGVLTTEPADVTWPWAVFLGRPGVYDFRGLRFSLKLDPQKAEGLVGGYADVESWYAQLVRSWSTHHSSYGGLSQPSLYPVLQELADGYPDKNGQMTAISSALKISMVQVFIQHSAGQVASTRD